MKIWGIISTTAAFFLLIFSLSLIHTESEISQQLIEERQHNTVQQNIHDMQIQEMGAKLDVLDALLSETPAVATNIDVKNRGENYGEPILSKNTTYLYPKATFISNTDLNKTLYVKFYQNGYLSTGNESPKGYSFSTNLSLEKMTPKEIEINGWGSETVGYWPAGKYRIEFWIDNKCIGKHSFSIQ